MFHESPRLGKIVLGPACVITVSHPDLIKEVLRSDDCLDRPQYLKLFKLDESLPLQNCKWSSKFVVPTENFKISDHKWKKLRKVYNLSLNRSNVQSFFGNFVECADSLVAKLEEKHENDVDLVGLVSECSLETGLKNLFGFQGEGLKDFDSQLKGVVESVEV